MEKKTPEQMYHDDITRALRDRDDYEQMWNDVDEILNGSYDPLMPVETTSTRTGKRGDNVRVVTHLLATEIDTKIAMTMPPPNLQFIAIPSSKEQEPDINSANTARCIADYYMNKQYGYDKMEECAGEYFAKNRGRMFIGFKPDTRETEEVVAGNVMGIDPGNSVAVFSEGEDKNFGQIYIDCQKAQNFAMCPGFVTIKEAWSGGGWVARRVYPHVDWVKDNDAIKSYMGKQKGKTKISDLQGDVKTANSKDPLYNEGEAQEEEKDKEDVEYKYMINWEIYKAPTKKYPEGSMVVYNQAQNTILFEGEIPIKGMGFPFREAIDCMPKSGDFAVPRAFRSIKPLLLHEYYETKRLKLVAKAKTVFIGIDNNLPDEWDSNLYSDKAIIGLKAENTSAAQSFNMFDVKPDTSAASEGSMASRAMFDSIMGEGLVDPRMGSKIATEMVYNQRQASQRMNRHIIKLNRFMEEVIQCMITATKQLVSPEEQTRMTRSVEKVWNDNNVITLDGNYSITIKSSLLADMSGMERAQERQMILQTLVSLEGLPQYAGRMDSLQFIKDWLLERNIPIVGMFREGEDMPQDLETALMLSKIPVMVEPQDNHAEHIQKLQEYQEMLKEGGYQLDEEEMQVFAQHYTEHVQFLEKMQQGAQGVNATNLYRQAEGEMMGAGATPFPSGAGQ